MGKNKKKGILIISCLFVILLSIFLYPRKDDNKSIIKKSYAFKIKNNGATSYTSVDTIPSDLTNYHIDEEKTICENGGKVSIVGNKLAYQTLGSDRCSVYLYYEKLHDITLNVQNPECFLGGYTLNNIVCDNDVDFESIWDYKINGFIIDNISKTNSSCDITFRLKTPNNEELLSTIVNNKATRNENGKRYQGKNPDNYIWFNDELWRIIGNIPVCLTSGCASTENRVKIIRNDSIGGLVYNIDYSSTWMGSNIQNLLNICYLGKTSSCDDYCYSGPGGVASLGTCDYSSNEIDTSDFYGKMVEDVYFNVGEGDVTYKTAANYYTQEIATHATSTSKIGLMYASDWGYAIEGFTGVLGSDGSPWNSSDKNWLFSNGFEWTMSAYNSMCPLNVFDVGYLDGDCDFTSMGFSIRPVLYLKSNVYVVSGTGSKVDPYRIGM